MYPEAKMIDAMKVWKLPAGKESMLSEICQSGDYFLEEKIDGYWYEYEKTDKVYINYKGYNLTVPMVVWEFEAECLEWSIKNVKMEGDTPFNKHFVVGKKDSDVFLDLIYFFLVENDSDAMIQERYKAEWDE